MEKILTKSVETACILFPKAYSDSKNWKRRVFHFCFIYKKSNLLSIGINQPYEPNSKVIKLAKNFKVHHYLNYPYLHAEVDAISKLWGKYHIDSSLRFVVLRINREGHLLCSKPCDNCSIILKALDIHKVWWSNDNGGFDVEN